jgi:hypothetical protein
VKSPYKGEKGRGFAGPKDGMDGIDGVEGIEEEEEDKGGDEKRAAWAVDSKVKTAPDPSSPPGQGKSP